MPAKIKINTRLRDTTTVLERKILDSLANQINARLRKIRTSFRESIRVLIKQMILDTPEAESMQAGGILSGEFGFYPGVGEIRIDAIAQRVRDSARVDFTKIKRKGKELSGRIRIRVVVSDFSDVFSIPEHKYISEQSGEAVEWLKWLLLEGDKIINTEYGIKWGGPNSRSGLAYMLPLTKKFIRPFRVSPQFTGTQNDNWLTRPFERRRQFFINEVLKILKGLIL